MVMIDNGNVKILGPSLAAGQVKCNDLSDDVRSIGWRR